VKAKADFDRESAFFIDNFMDKTLDKTTVKMQNRMQIIFEISDSSATICLDKNEDICKDISAGVELVCVRAF
jgi:hypothetical protein